ncbi:MAG TPA: hypothetical protein VFM96_12045 [Gaiellaceae bacterium]|nr:hypothetical protein [Gaiellaceae bacterium]
MRFHDTRQGHEPWVTNRRLKNSERKLQDLEAEEAEREDQPGILELFLRPGEDPDEDAPLSRDDSS